jgi:hypothetical protein
LHAEWIHPSSAHRSTTRRKRCIFCAFGDGTKAALWRRTPVAALTARATAAHTPACARRSSTRRRLQRTRHLSSAPIDRRRSFHLVMLLPMFDPSLSPNASFFGHTAWLVTVEPAHAPSFFFEELITHYRVDLPHHRPACLTASSSPLELDWASPSGTYVDLICVI